MSNATLGLGLIEDDEAVAQYYEDENLAGLFDFLPGVGPVLNTVVDAVGAVSNAVLGTTGTHDLPADQAGPPAPGDLQLAVNGNSNAWGDVGASVLRILSQAGSPLPAQGGYVPVSTVPPVSGGTQSPRVVVVNTPTQQPAAPAQTKQDIPWDKLALVGAAAAVVYAVTR